LFLRQRQDGGNGRFCWQTLLTLVLNNATGLQLERRFAVASVLVFLGLVLFMFQAGYQWHKWQPSEPEPTPPKRGRKVVATPRDTMIGKI
jgi:hypothetical protein